LLAKALGAVLVLGGGLWVGNAMAGLLEARVVEWQRWERALAILASRVGYAAQILPDALRAAGRQVGGTVESVLVRVSREVAEGRATAEEAWTHTCREYPGPLGERDWELLAQIGAILGRTGRSDQQRQLVALREQAAERCREAREESRQLGRLYRYVGILLAALLVLWLP